MKTTLFSLFTSLILNCLQPVTAQKDTALFLGKIIHDTASFKTDPYHGKLPSIACSGNKVEIRLIRSVYGIRLPHGKYESSILSYNLLSGWNFQKSAFNAKEDSVLIQKTLPEGRSFFDRLVQEQIFSIPDEDAVDLTEYTTSYDPATDEFTGKGCGMGCGGETWYIEYKVGNRIRRYSYSNPGFLGETYTFSPELNHFLKILELFKELEGN